MHRHAIHIFASLLALAFLGNGGFAWAKDTNANKYASIIIDADSLEILHARKIDGARFPASLTKMMTLYLTFDAIERGELTLKEPLRISAHATRAAPVRLGLRAGRTITTEQAIQALTVRSANDVAVVLSERIGGSEPEFAVLMTNKAKSLGMRSTVFKNPHGLPNPNQVTTARDMAKLAEALLRNHRKYYPYFSQQTFVYRGRTYKNHNTLLGKVKGVDGFKTGYTNASGYNLVLSAQRDGRRIIAVVLGGASGKSRDQHMADLLERGFDVIRKKQTPRQQFALKADERKTTRRVLPVPTSNITPLRAHYTTTKQGNVWAVQIGAFSQEQHAQNAATATRMDVRLNLGAATPLIMPVQRTNGIVYRARLTGIPHAKAIKVCKTLAASGRSCLVVAP